MRCENPKQDEFYFHDRALAHIDGIRFGRELGIDGFTEEYVEQYLNAFGNYPEGRENKEVCFANKEAAKVMTIEYFSRIHSKAE